MQDRHLFALTVAGILAAGVIVFRQWDDRPTQGAPVIVTDDRAAGRPRFDPSEIALMERQLRREPKVVDLMHNESASAVDWQIGVHSDGTSRIGYAGYACQLLRAANLVDEDTDVRIVDIDYLDDHPGAFRAASLGHVRCSDEAVIDT